MKEVLRNKPAAAALSIGLALGLTACSSPFENNDPNDIATCPDGWSTWDSSGTVPNFIAVSMAQLEGGRTQLVSNIQENAQSIDNRIYKTDVPAKYSAAASLLIGSLDQYTYDASVNPLSTPHQEFCQDKLLYTIYQSPAYVRAAAALHASGIDIATKEQP